MGRAVEGSTIGLDVVLIGAAREEPGARERLTVRH